MLRNTEGLQRNPRYDGLRWAFFGAMACLLTTLLGMKALGLSEAITGRSIPMPAARQASMADLSIVNVSDVAGSDAVGSSAAAPATQPLVNDPTISPAEYDRIRVGMTEVEVLGVVGDEGELLAEDGQEPYHIAMRLYKGADTSRASVVFMNGRVTRKAEIGLR